MSKEGDSPAQRALRARIAANMSWAYTPDRSQRTANGRRAFLARFEHQVDPEGLLPEAERVLRARHLLKAHMQRLALRSAQTRRRHGGTSSHD